MIPRYSRPEMTAIWSPETRFRIWFEIEAHALDAMAEIGMVPKSAAREVRRKSKGINFDLDRIEDLGLIAAINAVYPEAVPVGKAPSFFDAA